MFARTTVLLVALVAAEAESPQSFGDVGRLIREHDVGTKVTLARVLQQPHAYGLGSLSNLRGEITIVDGEPWLAYPPKSPQQDVRVVTEGVTTEKAAFLVATHVDPDAWTRVVLPDGVSSKDLELTLVRAARVHGLQDRELVFRVMGRLEALTLSIVDGRRVPPGPGSEQTLKDANVIRTVEAGAEAELVGFYTPADESPFTHPGKHTHVHAVVEKERATGHAQDFALRGGAVLWLQGTTALAKN